MPRELFLYARMVGCEGRWNHNDCLSIVKGDAQDHTVLGVYCKKFQEFTQSWRRNYAW